VNDLADRIRHLVQQAAHLLPAQGPITSFVHHNTLHAFEEMGFEAAVDYGAHRFGCHPYLTEARFRELLEQGRIRAADIEAELDRQLGDRSDELLGFLGTRFSLRRAILKFPFPDGPQEDIRWVLDESQAFDRFRNDVPADVKNQFIKHTSSWALRDLRGLILEMETLPSVTSTTPLNAAASNKSKKSNSSAAKKHQAVTQRRLHAKLRPRIVELLDRLDVSAIESWSARKWESLTLQMLWEICEWGVEQAAIEHPFRLHSCRHRDWLLELTGLDVDESVNELLIRFCGAFIDQGLSTWALPNRDIGFFKCFVLLYRQPAICCEPWQSGLAAELNRLHQDQTTPTDSILESLQAFGVAVDQWQPFLESSLLALPGFGGMIWQLETRGDRVSRPMPVGTLLEFLAIRLLLDRFAVKYVARTGLKFNGELKSLADMAIRRLRQQHDQQADSTLRTTFRVFEIAQLLGWKPEVLARLRADEWKMVIHELNEFSGIERRKIYQGAYERKYLHEALDAILVHSQRVREMRLRQSSSDEANSGNAVTDLGSGISQNSFEAALVVGKSGDIHYDKTRKINRSRRYDSGVNHRPQFQICTCIDDREESFRRHLEEIAPRCQTFAAAGFYAIPIYYRGAADAYFKPLCPAVMVPKHYVREEVAASLSEKAQQRKRARRTIGTVTHRVHIGSRTFTGGWFGTALLGTLATFPLVARILFPRMTAKIRSAVGGFVRPPENTELRLERATSEPGPADDQLGFRIEEMADIVIRLLSDIGLTKNLSRLVLIAGHGSSSLNNPHESAYNCGACAGGKGGPNARAFAQMGNDPRVRRIVREQGLSIPDDTVFVGGYHNTCDDSVTWYDVNLIPSTHQAEFDWAVAAIKAACQRNAHERSRRFGSAPLNLTFENALKHVEGRSEDLSQARPEYNHATNAMTLVGRREWSRGLFLDRRSFLQSYDPDQDDAKGTILARILGAVIPVCAGISLEYYFSCVDPIGWGAGNKLPHNITSLLGVMEGTSSDLRPGLYCQMTEIHEPMRHIFVIETTASIMQRIIEENPAIGLLCHGGWVRVVVYDLESNSMKFYRDGKFVAYCPQSSELPVTRSSFEWYRGSRENLPFASIES